MPIVSIFLGIVIKIFHEDHNPPHFHVEYGDFKALIEIKTGKIIQGRLPKRISRLVEEWRTLNEFAIQQSWKLAQTGKNPKRIKPLE